MHAVGTPESLTASLDASLDASLTAPACRQCSGDAAFLDELLVDLWNEANEHAKQLRAAVPQGKNIVSAQCR